MIPIKCVLYGQTGFTVWCVFVGGGFGGDDHHGSGGGGYGGGGGFGGGKGKS